jgi:hypothetical protein
VVRAQTHSHLLLQVVQVLLHGRRLQPACIDLLLQQLLPRQSQHVAGPLLRC